MVKIGRELHKNVQVLREHDLPTLNRHECARSITTSDIAPLLAGTFHQRWRKLHFPSSLPLPFVLGQVRRSSSKKPMPYIHNMYLDLLGRVPTEACDAWKTLSADSLIIVYC